jgi:hypothetical protein
MNVSRRGVTVVELSNGIAGAARDSVRRRLPDGVS